MISFTISVQHHAQTWRTRQVLAQLTGQAISCNTTMKSMDLVPLSRKLYVVKQVSKRDATVVEQE